MQDFLKDRPVIEPQQAKVVTPTAAPTPGATSAGGPFARIVRSDATIAAAATRPAAATMPGKSGPGPMAAAAAHTSQVKTVVENGRIARLIVTCSCGKVTEIACSY